MCRLRQYAQGANVTGGVTGAEPLSPKKILTLRIDGYILPLPDISFLTIEIHSYLK
jgi:hypothetical protein